MAFTDTEVVETNRMDLGHFDIGDASRRRRLAAQVVYENLQPRLGSLDENFDALFAIKDPTG
jgi:hypothetical protein